MLLPLSTPPFAVSALRKTNIVSLAGKQRCDRLLLDVCRFIVTERTEDDDRSEVRDDRDPDDETRKESEEEHVEDAEEEGDADGGCDDVLRGVDVLNPFLEG